jgi:hypothetical protein
MTSSDRPGWKTGYNGRYLEKQWPSPMARAATVIFLRKILQAGQIRTIFSSRYE